jgi:hypothetical protein
LPRIARPGLGTRSEHAVLGAILVALVLSAIPLAGSSADASPSVAQTYMFVNKRFYSLYERIDIRFDLTVPASCVKDEFGV